MFAFAAAPERRLSLSLASWARLGLVWALVAILAACASRSKDDGEGPYSYPEGMVSDASPLPAPIVRPKSQWQPVRWSHLPGLSQDDLHDAWNAWLKSCERPHPAFAPLCGDIRRLSITSQSQKWHWLQTHMQPYRVQNHNAQAKGLLTAYYEPELIARRTPDATFRIPLYAAPADLAQRTPWYTRQEIDTLPAARQALVGREIAWLADPIEALILHIQGSGRLHLREADGSWKQIRVAYAATNEQPYRSVGRWLLDRGLVKDASWPGISAWIAANPERTQEMLWSNPRYVFFREEPLQGIDAMFGPKGAQGVALTPGRSIAVDRQSIPYGTPVWLSTTGPATQLNRLVMAQDTGSAITGAVRADYFMGWGAAAGDLAGRVKQDLYLWVLWPKKAPAP